MGWVTQPHCPRILFCLIHVGNSVGMCGDLVPRGLGDGTGFPKYHTLGTQAQSGISRLRRVRMKGQSVSVCLPPTPFHLQIFPSASGSQPALSHFSPPQTLCHTQSSSNRGIVFCSLCGWCYLPQHSSEEAPSCHAEGSGTLMGHSSHQTL